MQNCESGLYLDWQSVIPLIVEVSLLVASMMQQAITVLFICMAVTCSYAQCLFPIPNLGCVPANILYAKGQSYLLCFSIRNNNKKLNAQQARSTHYRNTGTTVSCGNDGLSQQTETSRLHVWHSHPNRCAYHMICFCGCDSLTLINYELLFLS